MIVLVGFAGSYKSSAGKILAEKLHTNFYDTDVLAENATTLCPKDYILQFGEQAFRLVEGNVIAKLTDKHAVVAVGGGTPLVKGFASFAQNATVVWLKTSAGKVFERIAKDGSRPLFDGLTLSELSAVVEKRNDVYSKYACFTVVTDGKTPLQVADELLAVLTQNNIL